MSPSKLPHEAIGRIVSFRLESTTDMGHHRARCVAVDSRGNEMEVEPMLMLGAVVAQLAALLTPRAGGIFG